MKVHNDENTRVTALVYFQLDENTRTKAHVYLLKTLICSPRGGCDPPPLVPPPPNYPHFIDKSIPSKLKFKLRMPLNFKPHSRAFRNPLTSWIAGLHDSSVRPQTGEKYEFVAATTLAAGASTEQQQPEQQLDQILAARAWRL